MVKKKSITSIELSAVINELQFLKKGKVDQIYHPDKREIIIRFHVSGKGKQMVRIIPGSIINLTKEKKETIAPSSFCMQLRKYISNSIVDEICQKNSERIIIFKLQKKENYSLIIELFSKGNLILVDDKGVIITALERQRWKARTIKPKERYVPPDEGFNWQESSINKLKKVFQDSGMDNIVKSLATDVGLGGVYAEEICARAEIDKKKLLKELTTDDIEKITKEIAGFIRELNKPKGFVYGEIISPIELKSLGKTEKTFSTYNGALQLVNPLQKSSPYVKKINQLKNIIEQQEETVQKLDASIETNTKKAESIYNNYQKLEKLLEIVNKIQQNDGWEAVGKELKKVNKISSVDLKNKKVVVEL